MNSSIGLEASAVPALDGVVKFIANFPKSHLVVPLIYNLGGLKCILNKDLREQYYNLYIDGVDYSGTYININTGNTFGNGGNNAPNPYAVPDDGLINVILVKPMSVFKCLTRFSDYVKGRSEKYPDDFIRLQCKHIKCSSDKILRVNLDGEYYLTNETEMEIIPKAVKVVVPENIEYQNYFQSLVDRRKSTKGNVR
jgi:diacylglycerol kinase family enzyme